MKDVAVVAYCRTGIAKAVRGVLNQTHGIPLLELGRRGARKAVIGVCSAGGMATAAYLER